MHQSEQDMILQDNWKKRMKKSTNKKRKQATRIRTNRNKT
jgi:hypothetical protein